ncbi:MAG: dienelactone hydrolase family protein [Polyangiaceae bacterium]
MPKAPMEAWRLRDDPLDDFETKEMHYLERTRRVFVAGKGPAVIVMTEMPGISPEVAKFARIVRDANFTVYMPDLFGDAGRVPSIPYGLREMVKGCVSKEFRALRANVTAPLTLWLRALAADVFPKCGGKGVGAIGMCFTGNFALSMMLEPAVRAPVLCQPSLPIGRKGGIHSSPEDLAAIKERLEKDDLSVLGYRFEGDAFCRKERFDAYEKALGSRVHLRTLPSSAANPASHMANPHSVVTQHLIDEAGQPTRAAVDEILGFFHERLDPS